MGMVQEFKEFALKGNMVDMAVGIVMGGAIGGLVKSMVDNLINPIVGLFTGGVDLSSLTITLKDAVPVTDGGEGVPALLFQYGSFITAFINFLILAFVIFMIVKAVNTAKQQLNLVKEAAPAGPSEVDLLKEIRDSLKR